jgi:hypothetical protein
VSRVIYSRCYVHAAFYAQVGYRVYRIFGYDSGGVFVHCTVEEGKLILDRILLVTPLEGLQLEAPHISEEEPIITYPDASEVSTSPARELLKLTALEISSNKEEDDPTPFPLSIKEDCFAYDIGNLSKAPICDKKGLFFEPARQDQDEFMVSQENLLRLSTVISRGSSEAIEEDDNYVRFILVPTLSAAACMDSHSRWVVMIQGWD